MALAVMSTAFTGQAIGVGFERQYGVLKRLGATPLPRIACCSARRRSRSSRSRCCSFAHRLCCGITLYGFRREGSGQFLKSLHTFVPGLRRGVEHRLLAGAIKDIRLKNRVTLSRQPSCHLLGSSTNAADIRVINDPRETLSGFGTVEKSIGNSIRGADVNLLFEHCFLLTNYWLANC